MTVPGQKAAMAVSSPYSVFCSRRMAFSSLFRCSVSPSGASCNNYNLLHRYFHCLLMKRIFLSGRMLSCLPAQEDSRKQPLAAKSARNPVKLSKAHRFSFWFSTKRFDDLVISYLGSFSFLAPKVNCHIQLLLQTVQRRERQRLLLSGPRQSPGS